VQDGGESRVLRLDDCKLIVHGMTGSQRVNLKDWQALQTIRDPWHQ
jgi:hypothetical protein